MRDLPVDEFLSRLAEMPDIEALEQIEMRRDTASMQSAVIHVARAELEEQGRRTREWRRLGQELSIMAADQSRMALVAKQIRRRMDACSWSKAVTALYGQEGYNACRQFIVATEVQMKSKRS